MRVSAADVVPAVCHRRLVRYLNFLLGPDGAPGGSYGVADDSILTGFVGLAVADALSFGVTF